MSATIAQIRSALATALEAAKPTNGCQVSAYMLDGPTPPTLQVMGPDEVDFHQAMANGMSEIVIVIQAFAGTPLDRSAQELLDAWYFDSDINILDAVEADGSLGGIVDDCVVERASGYRIYNLPNRTESLGCEFFVRIYNKPG